MTAEDMIKALSGALDCTHSAKSSVVCIGVTAAEAILGMLTDRIPKSGELVCRKDENGAGFYCTVCGVRVFPYSHRPKRKLSKYCPHCGARFVNEGEKDV